MSKLRYRISKWEQAVKCKSNLSDQYSIHVSSVDYTPDISGKLIQVQHQHVGVVFSVLLDPRGERVDSNSNLHPMPTEQILNYLRMFGFNIEYHPEASLPEEQRRYLQEIQNLHMDKIRILYVRNSSSREPFSPILTAFLSPVLSDWLLNTYSCTRAEFDSACGSGLAVPLDKEDFDWSWLTYVANIEDLLTNK